MMKANPDTGGIVITGATGWMGLTVMQELYQILPQKEAMSRIHAFASQKRYVQINSETFFPVEPLQNLSVLAKETPIAVIIHCAFLTPDKLALLGAEKFIAINKSITYEVSNALRLNPLARVVSFSSGVAGHTHENSATTAVSSKDIYGRLKLDEESRFRELATTLVLRIFALTGKNARNPRQYAFGNFIYQALTHGRIIVRSKRTTIRSYAPAVEISRLAILWALSNEPAPNEPVASITHTIQLVELANTISSRFAVDRPIYSLDSDLPPDSYTANPDEFLQLLKRYDILCPSLEKQIDETRLAFQQ